MTYVLIHGGGATARFWDRLVPYLDRPAIAVDMPGRAGKPADLATLSVEDEVASIVEDLVILEPGTPVTVVAASRRWC
jgi:pimeloyl-ACP methyl ester carboxylesterase